MLISRFFKIVGTITLIHILAQLLGFAREVAIGYQYGTSVSADSIITAFTVPNFLYVVIGGSVTTAFISVYSKLDEETRDKFVQTILTYLTLFIGLVTVLFIGFPNFWMDLIFPGLSTEALELTSKLFRVTAPATFFLVLSMLFSGLHNVYENFKLTTSMSLVFNLSYFVIGFGLTPLIMEYSYSLGAMLGSGLMFTILIYQVRSQNLMPLRFRIDRLPETKRFLRLAMPLILGGATLQFYIIIQRIFAATLDNGAISAMNYSSKMTQFPQAVLMASVTTVIYPMLAKAAGDGDKDKIKSAYSQGFRLLSLILIPASVYMYMYAREIISLVFQYGSFSVESTNMTYPLLQIFSLSIFSFALNTYVTRFFYALENTLLPNMLNVFSVFVVNIMVIRLFIDDLGVSAIALATVVSTIFNMILLIIFARTQLKLHICRWQFLVQLAMFSSLVTGIFMLIKMIPITSVFLSLLFGGLILIGLIGVGLKIVRE